MLMGGMGIVWILVFAGIAYLFQESFQKKRENDADNHIGAVEVLKRRYAKGDIDKNEFDQKKRDLL